MVCFCTTPSGHDCHQILWSTCLKQAKSFREFLGGSEAEESFLSWLQQPWHSLQIMLTLRDLAFLLLASLALHSIFTFQFWLVPWDYSKFLLPFHFINKHAWEQNPQALFICIKLIHQQIAVLLWKRIFSFFCCCLCKWRAVTFVFCVCYFSLTPFSGIAFSSSLKTGKTSKIFVLW